MGEPVQSVAVGIGSVRPAGGWIWYEGAGLLRQQEKA